MHINEGKGKIVFFYTANNVLLTPLLFTILIFCLNFLYSLQHNFIYFPPFYYFPSSSSSSSFYCFSSSTFFLFSLLRIFYFPSSTSFLFSLLLLLIFIVFPPPPHFDYFDRVDVGSMWGRCRVDVGSM